jgi:WD40 repeat protein
VAWAPDGKHLALASHDRTVRVWDSDSGEIFRILEIPSRVTSLAWERDSLRRALSYRLGFQEIWDLKSDPPRPLIRLCDTLGGSGFAATPDGYVSGPPEALEYVRFGDGWALYDLTDVPERLSPERVAAALSGRPPSPKARKKPRTRK